MLTPEQTEIADVYAARIRNAETIVEMDNVLIQLHVYIDRMERRNKEFNSRELLGYIMAQVSTAS